MRIGVLGINHKLAHLDLRELLAKACQRHFAKNDLLHPYHSCVLLSTCNRTEVYFSSDNLSETHSYLLTILRREIDCDFDQKLYSFFGLDCFHHLCRVTTGLDSAIPAETDIQRQVKEAYGERLAALSLPSELHYLFQKSLKIAKQVRHHFSLQLGLFEIEHAIFNAGLKIFDTSKSDIKILFVGASAINMKLLRFLQSKQYSHVTLCNRTQERLDKLMLGEKIAILPWQALNRWPQYDWIICGTKAQEFLLHPEDLHHPLEKAKLLIDLSVPRNIHPLFSKKPHIHLLNIEQIQERREQRHHHFSTTLISAEKMIADASKNYVYQFQKKTRPQLTLAAMA